MYLTQSRLCVIQKDLAGASEHLREGLASNPRNPELLEALAEVELQARRPDRALEALGQVPQLPEKALALCERALRDTLRSGTLDEGLRLFKPIGRELARRGQGEVAAKSLRAALGGSLTQEAWIQLADIAHQSGNRAEQVECLRQAHGAARTQGDRILADTIAQQLQGMGVRLEDLDAPAPGEPRPAAAGAPASPDAPSILETTELDPIKRMQIQQLEREAEQSLRNRFVDRALETFARILEMDPANVDVINRIADIHRASGVLTKVQMHYVKTAERVALLGYKVLAVELLDKAEAMFPGSTRLYRRNLGLLDIQAAPSVPLPPSPSIPLAAPVEALPVIELDGGPSLGLPPVPSAPALEDFLQLPPLILDAPPVPPASLGLPPQPAPLGFPPQPADLPPQPAPWDLPGDPASWQPPAEPAPWTPPAEPEALALPEGFPPLDLPEPSTPRPDPFAQPLSLPGVGEPTRELDWEELTAGDTLPGLKLPPFPEPPAAPAAVDEELASLLSDIDFQLDYGSPEEAKIEIQNALRVHPDHPELLRRLDAAEDSLRRLGHAEAAPALQESDFADSFFDLTDVLGDALMETGEGEEMHDATGVVEKIQSVDELFDAFREGVEQQVKGDDYDTHYNLGIAYKEMMLLEPALEEFKKAMRDPERTLECCSMLAICEHSQGNLEGAIQWLREGIQAPGFPPEDSIGLRYDLGSLLMEMGRRDEALTEFRQVKDLDPDYRDVAQLV